MIFSVKEYIYLIVVWSLRYTIGTKYGYAQTQYTVTTESEYQLAIKIASMLGDIGNGKDVNCASLLNTAKFPMTEFIDIIKVGDAARKYELDNKIRWLTMEDLATINMWRDSDKYDIKTGLFKNLYASILFEFL